MLNKQLEKVDYNIIKDELDILNEKQVEEIYMFNTLKQHGKRAEPKHNFKYDCQAIKRRINARQLIVDTLYKLQDKLLKV